MKSKKMKAFKRLVWAKADIAAARDLTEILLTNLKILHENLAYRAIETGIVVSYARPFGENDNLGTLPNEFRQFDDAGAQIAHDGILRARDIQEAHNNLRERGSLIQAPFTAEEAINVEVEIKEDGRTFWEVRPPSLAVGQIERMLKLFRIQEDRLEKEIQSSFALLLREHPKMPGIYKLGVDFP
ncbi:MAG: hypothetical protein DME97_10695 [Verrucomicrobia bacterium]|nr:MAG: hypothetical protein DME97_10695 [Verrucomicrobiota bacterium]